MILITGINGEMGRALISKLHALKSTQIVGLDIKPPNQKIGTVLHNSYVGDIRNEELIKKIFQENEIDTVYHLAAVLSTKAESIPFLAHQINVDGFLNLMNQIMKKKKLVKFFFPSSIAVYTINQNINYPITENEFCYPNNIYGCNKLYCENLGRYFSGHSNEKYIDFRSIRFCGIISADTLPQGGTSDYAPEMIHNACQNKNYTCFVGPESCIPFMVMPDAINAIMKLMTTDKSQLKKTTYHIQAFSPTVDDIYKKIISKFPDFKLDYAINEKRQNLINSWPANLNQTAAINDWGWEPRYNFDNCFDEYLIPNIQKKYQK